MTPDFDPRPLPLGLLFLLVAAILVNLLLVCVVGFVIRTWW